jgi:hypothetical protein
MIVEYHRALLKTKGSLLNEQSIMERQTFVQYALFFIDKHLIDALVPAPKMHWYPHPKSNLPEW